MRNLIGLFGFLVLFNSSLFGQNTTLAIKDAGESEIRFQSGERPLFAYHKLDRKHEEFSELEYKSYVSQLETPEGRNVLRDAPSDHLHHHALMFAITADGTDFWTEASKEANGVQIGTDFEIDVPCRGAKNVVVELKQSLDWLKPSGEKTLREKRTIQYLSGKEIGATLMSWTSALAVAEGKSEIELTGFHYSGLGMRFDASMDRDGRFFSSLENGAMGEHVRGDEHLTQCRWMVYTAKLYGKPVTVAVFDAPENPRPMTAFTMGQEGKSFAYLGATACWHKEPIRLEKDKPLAFQYGIAVWEGEKTPGEVEKAYQFWLKNIP